MKKSGADVPDWMLNLKKADRKEWKKLETKPIKRKTISTDVYKNTDHKFIKKLKKKKFNTVLDEPLRPDDGQEMEEWAEAE